MEGHAPSWPHLALVIRRPAAKNACDATAARPSRGYSSDSPLNLEGHAPSWPHLALVIRRPAAKNACDATAARPSIWLRPQAALGCRGYSSCARLTQSSNCSHRWKRPANTGEDRSEHSDSYQDVPGAGRALSPISRRWYHICNHRPCSRLPRAEPPCGCWRADYDLLSIRGFASRKLPASSATDYPQLANNKALQF